jgi:hypothetical protein
MKRWTIVFALMAGLLTAGAARAHDPGISSVQGTVTAKTIELIAGFAPADAQQFVPADSRTGGRMTPAEFVAVSPLLQAMAPQLWEARAGETVLKPSDVRVQLEAGDNVSFTVTFPRPPGDTITLRATQLGSLPPAHRQFVIIGDANGVTIAKKLMSANDDTITVPLNGAPAPIAG